MMHFAMMGDNGCAGFGGERDNENNYMKSYIFVNKVCMQMIPDS